MAEVPREIEIKIDLQSESNYRALIAFLKPVNLPVVQENHFFDTAGWDLSRAGWALRLRLEDGRATLTAKGKGEPAPDGLAIRTDIEIPIDINLAKNYIGDGLAFEKLPLPIQNLVPLPASEGHLEHRFFFRNFRLRLEPRDSYPRMRFEIDRTEFFDNSTDWELEVELTAPEDFRRSLNILKRLFGDAGIPLIFQKKSKFTRALALLKKGPEGNF